MRRLHEHMAKTPNAPRNLAVLRTGRRGFETTCSPSSASIAVSGRNVAVIVSDNIAPSVPTGLTATAISSSQINLSWSASTDTGGSGLAGYRVYRDGSGTPLVQQSGTTYSDTGLTASTLYSYRVSAYDNQGNESAQSSAQSATTAAVASAEIYSDDFASATVGQPVTGRSNENFRWDPPNAPAGAVVVSTEEAYPPSPNSLKFGFRAIADTSADDGENVEQRFTLFDEYPEIYIGYRLFVPPGFNMVDQASPYTSNKKFLAIWCEVQYAGWGACVIEHYNDGNGNSILDPTYRDQNNASEHGFYNAAGVFINKTTDVNKWMNLGFRYKLQTTPTVTGSGMSYRGSGILEVYKNNVQFMNITNFPNWNPNLKKIQYGYVMGAANGGYRVATPFYVAGWKVGTQASAIAEYLP